MIWTVRSIHMRHFTHAIKELIFMLERENAVMDSHLEGF